ncbi:hypothetical protein AB834_07060 [PVC group bacterium (ex Bugula neritina AB1)]|nr:hypothetical protein AB834_07060 [PVC group bacterium (ex Bugula neritina AB1)]
MYCGHCGAYGDSKNVFCINCGHQLSSEATIQNSLKTQPYKDPSLSQTSDSSKNSITRTIPSKNLRTDTSLPSKKYFQNGFIFADRYRIENLLGKGGMGEVYKVYDLNLGEVRALKVLNPSFLNNADLLQRFENEAQMIHRMNHINLVKFINYTHFENTPYIVMEYVKGISLREWMNKHGVNAPLKETIDIIIKVCQGLKEVHKYITHKDIKPENIIISESGSVKIVDFGISQPPGFSILSNDNSSIGTVYYAAPEQTISPSNIDQRADIFSVGVIIYEMLYAKVPIGRFKILPSKKKNITKKLTEIIQKSLESEVEDRYQSINSLLVDLTDQYNKISNPKFSPEQKKSSNNTETIPKKNNNFSTFLSILIIIAIFFTISYIAYKKTFASLLSTPQLFAPSQFLDTENLSEKKHQIHQNPMFIASKKLRIPFSFIAVNHFQRGDIWGDGEVDETPVKKIHMDSFYMSQYEITNGQYKVFINSTNYPPPVNALGEDSDYTIWNNNYISEELLNFPVVNISWVDANAFCRWLCEYENVPLSTYRLPTEAEWEFAATPLRKNKYPWGNEFPDYQKANFGKKWMGALTLKKVGSYPPNNNFLYDMAGNVWEWCQDTYEKDFYNKDIKENPISYSQTDNRVLRGGAWSSYGHLLRTSNRHYNDKNSRYYDNGFRIVRTIDNS